MYTFMKVWIYCQKHSVTVSWVWKIYTNTVNSVLTHLIFLGKKSFYLTLSRCMWMQCITETKKMNQKLSKILKSEMEKTFSEKDFGIFFAVCSRYLVILNFCFYFDFLFPPDVHEYMNIVSVWPLRRWWKIFYWCANNVQINALLYSRLRVVIPSRNSR